MPEKNLNNYISLSEATKFCNYSQEYLSLRARQGKLEAMKFGRNWVTKREWLEEYLRKIEVYNNQVKEKKIISPPKFFKEKLRRVKKKIIPSPPENLPVGEPIEITEEVILQPFRAPSFNFKAAAILVSLLLIAGFVSGKAVLWNVYEDTLSLLPRDLAEEINTQRIIFNYQITSSISEKLGGLAAAISSSDIFQSTLSVFKEYGQWAYSNIKNQKSKIKNDFLAINDFIKKEISQGLERIAQLWEAPEKVPEEKLAPKTKKGMVVVPSTEKDEEIKKEVKEAFSDQVLVEPKDETSGIIIPVFREREGGEYLYILVPIEN